MMDETFRGRYWVNGKGSCMRELPQAKVLTCSFYDDDDDDADADDCDNDDGNRDDGDDDKS